MTTEKHRERNPIALHRPVSDSLERDAYNEGVENALKWAADEVRAVREEHYVPLHPSTAYEANVLVELADRIEELTAQRDYHIMLYKRDLPSCLKQMERAEKAEAERDAAQAALRGLLAYVRHDEDCDIRYHPGFPNRPKVCTCELLEVLAEADAALSGESDAGA